METIQCSLIVRSIADAKPNTLNLKRNTLRNLFVRLDILYQENTGQNISKQLYNVDAFQMLSLRTTLAQ